MWLPIALFSLLLLLQIPLTLALLRRTGQPSMLLFCPMSAVRAVWRGVKGVDLTSDFPKGKKLFWWAFTSTSKNVSTLLNPAFCGTSGTRTQFMIEASSGVDIVCTQMLAP